MLPGRSYLPLSGTCYQHACSLMAIRGSAEAAASILKHLARPTGYGRALIMRIILLSSPPVGGILRETVRRRKNFALYVQSGIDTPLRYTQRPTRLGCPETTCTDNRLSMFFLIPSPQVHCKNSGIQRSSCHGSMLDLDKHYSTI